MPDATLRGEGDTHLFAVGLLLYLILDLDMLDSATDDTELLFKLGDDHANTLRHVRKAHEVPRGRRGYWGRVLRLQSDVLMTSPYDAAVAMFDSV